MKIAAIQMCSTPIVKDNLKEARRLLHEAAKKEAQLVVLPEMFPMMGETSHDKLQVQESLGEGPIQDFLAQQARALDMWIVGGTIPIRTENKNKISAASLVYNNQGQYVGRYNKIHLFDTDISSTERHRESETTEHGHESVVIDSPFGKIGLAVCYDVRFPELFRALVNQGAEIFTLPSAFTVKTGEAHWELLTRARAVENFCYVIGAAQGGRHSTTRTTYGHSIIIDPWGDVIAKIDDDKPGVIVTNIDLGRLHELRKAIPVLEHQYPFILSKL